MHKQRKWFAGVDWASQEHVVSLHDDTGTKVGQRKFAHGGAGLSDMIAWLLKASGGTPGEIHVAIETPHGPIVEALLERGFNVYSVNPKQFDRFRDRFTVSGAKDDSRDADVLADSLRTDMRAFRKLSIAEPTIVELSPYISPYQRAIGWTIRSPCFWCCGHACGWRRSARGMLESFCAAGAAKKRSRWALG